MDNILRSELENAKKTEWTGYSEYQRIAKIAYDAGECEIKNILMDMAYEEKSHANMLEHLLERS